MSTVVKDLGAVSAYAYAVEKGYTGTEAEFAELMADYAEVGQRAENAADSALNSKTAAETAATTATNKVSEATTAAQTATTKAGEASQSASQAQASAQTASTKASEASASASTATAKATEATTAAATAVSSKDAAVSANTAAQSAKTAAQTAQQGAETARDAVQASAAQIATNAEDINQLKEDLSTIANSYADVTMWSQGAINITNGEDAPSASRIHSSAIPKNIVAINITSGYRAVICCYSDNTYVGWWNGSTFSKADSGATSFQGDISLAQLSAYTVRLYVRSETGTSLSPTNDYQCVEFIKYTDDTLTKPNIPADAKKTGNAINAVKDTVISVQSPFVKLTKSSDIFTVEEGYHATTGNKVALAGYVLCSYTAEQDFQIYADAKTIAGKSALFVSIYNNSITSGNNVACYKRSDGTLPTEANKATVYAGQILAVSIYSPSSSPADFGIYANYYTITTLADNIMLNNSQIAQVANKFANFAYGKKIAWFGDSVSELRNLPHTAGSLMSANVYDCSIRGSVIGRTYSNYNTFSFCNLVTAIIDGDFTNQFNQLDAYEQAQGHTYPGIRENLTTLSTLDFDTVDYVVLLQGTNDFRIPINVQEGSGYANRVDEMQTLMDDAISRFITAYPKLKFYILSPFFRGDKSVDNYNNTLADYVEAEKTVAEKYAIPFYNLLTHSRICEQNKLTYLNSANDLVHPNDYGDAWLAELCAKFISVN